MAIAVRVLAVFLRRRDEKAQISLEAFDAEDALRRDVRIHPVRGDRRFVVGVVIGAGGVDAGGEQLCPLRVVEIRRSAERGDGTVRIQAHIVGIGQLPCGKAVLR